MTKTGACAAASLALSIGSARAAETIGVSMGLLGDDLFQTPIRDGMDGYVGTLSGVTIQVEDAGGDVSRQLDRLRDSVASGVSAIVVHPAGSSAAPGMSCLAPEAHMPLVHVDVAPDGVEDFSGRN